MSYFSFDTMGDIGFSRQFRMLERGLPDPGVTFLHKGQRPFGYLFPCPWLFLLLSRVPLLAADFNRFTWWCHHLLKRRRHTNPETPDIISYLIGDETPLITRHSITTRHFDTIEEWNQERAWKDGDSRLLVVAGSDTTAAALTYICFELARHPKHLAALRSSLSAMNVSVSKSRYLQNLPRCTHLSAIIHETLRLHPPTPSALLRVTPPEGLTFASTFIPGNVTVGIPTYSLSRHPSCFIEPDSFIPERWSTQPSLVLNKKAFCPFSLGPYGCVGKQLALMELRIVIALLVENFDICLADGEDGEALLERSEDVFTMALGNLWVRFVPKG